MNRFGSNLNRLRKFNYQKEKNIFKKVKIAAKMAAHNYNWL